MQLACCRITAAVQSCGADVLQRLDAGLVGLDEPFQPVPAGAAGTAVPTKP